MTTAGRTPITLRRLARDDLPRVRGWLAEPLVARWWNDDPAEAEATYGPSLRGEDPTVPLVASVDGEPFGFAQRYRLRDEPEYRTELSAILPVGDADASLDYLIGDPAFRGRGLGAAVIAAVCADAWAAWPDVDRIVVPVAAGNEGSWRTLERAGFDRVATGALEPDNPIDPPDHVVYALGRP